jgi:hypothetical protein
MCVNEEFKQRLDSPISLGANTKKNRIDVIFCIIYLADDAELDLSGILPAYTRGCTAERLRFEKLTPFP